MNAASEQIFIQALSLPTKTRAVLAAKLLVSLETDEPTAESESGWDQETLARYGAYKKGRIKARPTAEVMRDAYRRLK